MNDQHIRADRVRAYVRTKGGDVAVVLGEHDNHFTIEGSPDVVEDALWQAWRLVALECARRRKREKAGVA